ncbi:low affinity iron permease family protein [Nocardia sp. NBC_00881]|uniref:low affinity iron permease family protein n=1 Tax=Nocardia sp. NBC_00881 TaxID=2975995 RepID=UPI0038681C11|nr:low affinity iron permease family protein [Nocardia sp. NBC_00881]
MGNHTKQSAVMVVMMPTDVVRPASVFDDFAAVAGTWVSKGLFFVLAVALVLTCAVSLVFERDVENWPRLLTTATTIVTFVLVALLHNAHSRATYAMQVRLNALANALSVVKGETDSALCCRGEERFVGGGLVRDGRSA